MDEKKNFFKHRPRGLKDPDPDDDVLPEEETERKDKVTPLKDEQQLKLLMIKISAKSESSEEDRIENEGLRNIKK